MVVNTEYKLEPCPFCGGEPELIIRGSGMSEIVCKRCKLSMNEHFVDIKVDPIELEQGLVIDTLKVLVETWNTRKEPETYIMDIQSRIPGSYDNYRPPRIQRVYLTCGHFFEVGLGDRFPSHCEDCGRLVMTSRKCDNSE